MSDVFPKFIIEGDKLILSKVTYHHQIADDIKAIKGGGWFRYMVHSDTFVLYGDSHDFGRATLEDIKKCISEGKVYSSKHSDNSLTKHYNFAYDTGSETINLHKKA
jgi:hypothetical protein